MSGTLTRVAPELPGEREARTLTALFDDAQNGMRRVIALGLFAHEIKSQLKHGQFGPWLRDHAPRLAREVDGRPLASCQLTAYMQLASGVLESAGFKLGNFIETAKIGRSDLSHGGEILTLPDEEVPAPAREMRDRICSIIDGKTQRQLFLEFKTAEEEDGAMRVARPGGRKGRREDRSPQEELRARREQWEDLLSAWQQPLRAFLDAAEDGDELDREHWQAALDDLLRGTALARARLKKSSSR